MEIETKYLKFLPELLAESNLTFKQIENFDPKQNNLSNFCIGLKKYFIDSFINENLKQNPFNMSTLSITEIIHTSLLVPFFREKKENRKIYVIQKDFFSKFKDLDLAQLRFKHLPKEMTGYVELPEIIVDHEGMEIKGFFFHVGNIHKIANPLWNPRQSKPYEISDRIVGFAFSEDSSMNVNAFSWTHVPMDLDIKIVDSHKDVKTVTTDYDGEIEGVSNDYPKYLAVMYNLLTYLNTGAPDIRSFRNTLRYQSPTSKTPIKADKHLSNSNIIQVGFSFKKERLTHTDEWYVMPHMRWQACGVGLSEMRMVYVRGHHKHRI